MVGRLAFVVALLSMPQCWSQDKATMELPGLPAHMKIGQPAPNWLTANWFNLPDGKSKLDVDDYRGKVVVLFLFQSKCEGCRDGGVPILAAIRGSVQHADVRYVAIQAVYELAFANTLDAAKAFAKEFEFDFPVGHTGSDIMKRYHALFSPWFVIIDRHGKIQFSSFFVAPQKAKQVIEKALAEPAPKPVAKPKKRYWF